MNGLERTGLVLQGIQADHPPIALLISLMGARFADAGIHEYYTNPDVWVTGQQKLISLLDPDIVTGPFAFPIEAHAFGSKISQTGSNAPNVAVPVMNQGADIERLEIPDPSHPSLRFILDCNAKLVNAYQNEKAVASLLFSPGDFPALLFGIEGWIDILLFQKKWIPAIMEKTTFHFIRMANECLRKGANFIVTTANFCNPSIVTPSMFESLLPYLKSAFEKIEGPVVIHHGGCKLGDFTRQYAQLPNVIGLVVDPREQFKKIRSVVSRDTILLGNLDGPVLNRLKTDQVKRLCEKMLNDRKEDRKYIFATANADIPFDTPLETMQVVMDTIKNYGHE